MSNPLDNLSNDEIIEKLFSLAGEPKLKAYQAEMIRRAIIAIDEFNHSSANYSKRLNILTWILIVLTIVIASLTVKLAFFM